MTRCTPRLLDRRAPPLRADCDCDCESSSWDDCESIGVVEGLASALLFAVLTEVVRTALRGFFCPAALGVFWCRLCCPATRRATLGTL